MLFIDYVGLLAGNYCVYCSDYAVCFVAVASGVWLIDVVVYYAVLLECLMVFCWFDNLFSECLLIMLVKFIRLF